LILRTSKRVNDRHTVATYDRTFGAGAGAGQDDADNHGGVEIQLCWLGTYRTWSPRLAMSAYRRRADFNSMITADQVPPLVRGMTTMECRRFGEMLDLRRYLVNHTIFAHGFADKSGNAGRVPKSR
jgi:hypothetical protein